MKKKLLTILLGGMMLNPTIAVAQNDGGSVGNGNDPDYPSGITNNLRAYITTNQSMSFAIVCFVSSVENAEILVCLDGTEVDRLTVTATAGTRVPLYLPAYGTGELTIYVRRGTTLLAVFNTTL